jgi:hypothetical protein
MDASNGFHSELWHQYIRGYDRPLKPYVSVCERDEEDSTKSALGHGELVPAQRPLLLLKSSSTITNS